MPDEALPEQAAFIQRTPVGHGLLVAGPGTGKTFTLSGRCQYVVDHAEVPPDAIAVLTLTRSMVRSLAARMPYGRVQTFHAFALVSLNKIGAAWNRRVVDPWEEEHIVTHDLELGAEAAYQVGFQPNRVKSFLRRMAAAFREHQAELPEPSVEEQQLLQVFQQHRELFRYCLMDELAFDLVRLLDQGVDLPAPPRLVLADEYQDFTAGELRLLQVLSERFGTQIEAAGDDRQSIYGFRAADALALHKFPEVYGLEEVDYLFRSRRCPRAVCDFADAVAEGLPPLEGIERPPLEPWPGRDEPGTLRVVTTPGAVTEARWVVQECAALMRDGVAPSDIMIITSSFFDRVFAHLKGEAANSQTATFEFYDPRSTDPKANDTGVRLLSAGARLLVDRTDQMAWRSLVYATPGLGDHRLTRLLTANQASFLRNLEVVAGGDAVCNRPLQAGITLLDRMGQEETVDAVQMVELIAEQLGRPGLDLSVLRSLVGEEWETKSPREWLQAVFDISQTTQISPEERPRDIPVRTVFGAKGLEAPHVFLTTAIAQSFTRGDPADNVRRLYVAITRATEALTISAPRTLMGSPLQHAANTQAGGLAANITMVTERLRIPIAAV